jgi:phytoene synthase
MSSNQVYISTNTAQRSLLRLPYDMIRPVYEKTSFHRSVIDELSCADLRDAYAHCRAITRHHAKTFYLSTRFLPNEKQRSIFAIYALCRYIDDIVDETFDVNHKIDINPVEVRQVIDDLRLKLDKAYETGNADSPILIAFADTLRSYHIPKNLPLELIEGVCMDLHQNRFSSFDEIYTYSYKVASVVGLMTSEVFGYSNKEALKHAVDLGIAMQLTNILRDIAEDLGRNRIYIPLEDLHRFGITEADMFAKVKDKRFHDLMHYQIQRARSYYQSADIGIAMLDADSRLPVYLARMNYSRILDRIEEDVFKVFDERTYLSTSEKLAILPKAWINTMF